MHDLLRIAAVSISAVGAVVSVVATVVALRNTRKARQHVMTKEGSLLRGADVEEAPLPPSAFDNADEPDEK
jgi:hypothetical protein